MPSAVRHVQILDRHLATQSLTSEHIRSLIQSGTGTPPTTGSTYVVFTTAYGSSPIVDLYRIGPARGSEKWDTPRITPGSFVWQGSPTSRFRWRALGFRSSP